MIYLNLLPYKFKKELKLRYTYNILGRICASLILTLVFISGLFFSSSKVLSNFYNVIDSTNFLMGADVEEPIKVSNINTKINEISKINKKRTDWVNVMASSSLIFKDFSCINNLEIDNNLKKIKLKGVAHSRDSLIELKEDLDKSKYFFDINLPITNIFQKEYISFDLEANLNIK
ncbi:hypothetical protein K8R62_04250 [bacterium]|nr:hypothetical protein [bacterium]